MQENKFRKSIDLPKGPEFRKDLTRLALDRDFNSSKEMIEHDVIKQVEKYNQEAKKG
jgi:hypothetical protein